MLKVSSILILIFLGSTTSYSQKVNIENVHPSLRKAIDTLQAQGIDTILVYYSYCVGCEAPNSQKDCDNFASARILWKKRGQDFTRWIHCSKKELVALKTNSETFKYFLENIRILTERKPLAKGRFYPPLTVHYFSEYFYLLIGSEWYVTSLHEDQKKSKEWEKYSWILPTIKLSQLNKLEMDKN